MLVNLTKTNIALAKNKIKEDQILTIGRNGKRILVEYLSRSNGSPEVMLLQQKDAEVLAWHTCQAAKSNYANGCWHLALAAIVYDCEINQINIVGEPDQFWVSEDISDQFLSRPGKFETVNLSTEGPDPVPTEATIDISEKHKSLLRFNLPKTLLEKVIEFRERQIQRLSDEQKLRIPQNVNYIPQNGEVTYGISALLYDIWSPPLLMGPKGSGKSTLVEALAEILYLPICRISGGIDVNADYLLGCKTLVPVENAPAKLIAKIGVNCAKAGEPLTLEELKQLSGGNATMKVAHEPGVLLEAITKGEIILIDEINVLIPEVTSILHTLLDWQRTITVPGLGEVKAHPDFRLVAAMNVGYMGTRPLNNAFRDRFRGIQVQGVSRETLLELLQEKVSEDISIKLADIYEALYDSVYSPTGATLSENCISLRSLLRAAEEISMGIGSQKDIIISCLTESLENTSERTQVRDLVEMRL